MNFRRVVPALPVVALVQAIEHHPTLWRRHTLRQEFLGSPHWQTYCIYLRGPSDFTFSEYFMDIGAFDYDTPAPVWRAAADIVTAIVQATQATELGRVLIVTMPAGAELKEHRDEGVYAEHYDRVHVALVTNPRAELVCNGEARHIPAGEAWWFDHRAPHTAHNRGDSGRIHLIVDLVAPGLRHVR
jgi:quercetin dioxygenase-like cupin family protein